ncbi:nucleolar protein 10, putative [Entamoeba histolytica HM-1:IMSS-B]|uniref:Nucleolar protein 10, putative n=6 Tax=Entamoeba histolytica TaxID=5759 RepID=C4LW22_ENTH1|nr:nucleolar protein 10, putative [Entamoeba histolytica HM-1:IMSS]EMD44763.1 nucleolar protein, putative [Entamoeba histolytica KU27]EMH73681.1 nucleolar protein 10, putative [Entamoeba histolytica HM-1:IMSS-B]EMS14152.1 nucleolar protein 10, putative [Entamoeba histolytica HM-3:IMSS]ENY62085.1 nucleolar protein 10, putative [Entamoeba histolytica HM-1:IMSS-A]GAT92885.1 nucleolar protein 10 putative [Entamoeba histolytica]|eukprot:XP_649392.1 nucleolar protein 10, putative [Entamoeba histolytica HM-1:IMSS]
MKTTETGGVKVYNLTAGKTLPQWLSQKKKKELRKDEDFQKRIELIQDTEFPVNSQNVKFSPDGQFLGATGMYPPRIRMFELDQLSQKFERNLDAEITKFEFLEEDYSKLMFLLTDKTIEFHNKGGIQCKIKVPKTGRDFKYLPSNCNTYIATPNNLDIINLYEGKFYESIPMNYVVNCLDISEKYQLLFCGCEGGIVSVIDPMTEEEVSVLDVNAGVVNKLDVNGKTLTSIDVTSIAYDGNLQMTVGTSNGNVLTYDLRSSKPILSSYHQNRIPIVKTLYHTTQNGEFLVTADANIVRFSNKSNGKLVVPLEANRRSVITDVAIAKDSGLCVLAGDFSKLQIYYIPSLGIAPSWCSFLENLTEELEDEPTAVYDDFHFVTKQELHDLGMDSFIGSEYLRPYMHGYFMHIKLYQRAMALKQND